MVSGGLVVVLHGLDVISVINDHNLDRINVDGQGVFVVESDAYHFTYGRSSILVGSGNLVSIVLRSTVTNSIIMLSGISSVRSPR